MTNQDKRRAAKRKSREKRHISKQILADRKKYAKLFFNVSGTTLSQENRDTIDLSALVALQRLKDGDFTLPPRIEVAATLCAAIHLAKHFPEEKEIVETLRFAYLSLSFAFLIFENSGLEAVKNVPGLFEPLDFGIDLYSRMHAECSAQELLSAVFKTKSDLKPVIRLVQGKACSLILPDDKKTISCAKEDVNTIGRTGIAWIHDAPTRGHYDETERGYFWIKDDGTTIKITKATPVIWDNK